MSKRKNNVKLEKKKKLKDKKVAINKSIPDNIKILFGKFYFYSFVYILFFFIAYPIFLMNKLTTMFSVMLIILLTLFFCYMVYDVYKKKGKYMSITFVMLILIVLLGISFSVIKLFI